MRFRFNEPKTAQAAAQLLKLNGGKINHMVLIKLLYLADRETLLHHNQPITGASMVSMERGPVLSQVLDLINEGSTGLWSEYVTPSSDYEVSLKVEFPETSELSRYECRVLGEVYAKFGKMDKWHLVEWLHKNVPEWKDPNGSATRIEFVDVFRANNVSEESIQRINEDAELHWEIGSLVQ
jgi:uncharacterized phage-associated protein